jgi:hypothetical protein
MLRLVKSLFLFTALLIFFYLATTALGFFLAEQALSWRTIDVIDIVEAPSQKNDFNRYTQLPMRYTNNPAQRTVQFAKVCAPQTLCAYNNYLFDAVPSETTYVEKGIPVAITLGALPETVNVDIRQSMAHVKITYAASEDKKQARVLSLQVKTGPFIYLQTLAVLVPFIALLLTIVTVILLKRKRLRSGLAKRRASEFP